MSSTRVIRRQPRGSINKRACENCRRLKIRCDGDAEQSTGCSNCDAGTCVFDKSPRKNRQVEKLSNQVSNLEADLEKIQDDLYQQTTKSSHAIAVLKLEKEIQGQLYACQNYFNDCRENQVVFEQLNQIIAKSQCWSILLPLTRELLFRLSQNSEPNSIIGTLKMIAENTLRFCQPDSSLNSMINPPPELTELISPPTTTLNNADPYNGNASSPSEIISESVSPAYSMPTNVSSPTLMINLQSPISDGSEIGVSQSHVNCVPGLTPDLSNLYIGDFTYYFNEME